MTDRAKPELCEGIHEFVIGDDVLAKTPEGGSVELLSLGPGWDAEYIEHAHRPGVGTVFRIKITRKIS